LKFGELASSQKQGIVSRMSALFDRPHIADRFANDSEMAALIRTKDWGETPLGRTSDWSPSLRMMVGVLLANRFPLLLWWGPEYISIYNDAYRPILGNKHPRSLGQPVRECWSEIWHVLQPLIDTPFNGGPSTWMEDIPLEIARYDFIEETHFTIAYSPVPDETIPSGIGGVLATVHEITEKVVGERRVALLRDLAARTGEARTAVEACKLAADILAKYALDIPFAAFYLIDQDAAEARLVGSVGMEEAGAAVVSLRGDPRDCPWPLSEVIRDLATVTVEDLPALLPVVPPGPWSDPPACAVALPIYANRAGQIAGVLVAGISSRLRLDGQYRSFLELAAAQVASAIATASAYEEERRRAEALAEIDRAKTAFFTNVSHEFRTPLTLMLGPLEDALTRSSPAQVGHIARNDLELMHRNGLRLLKLVNTLLEFSRIEAGRMEAAFEPVDLARLTEALASNFRSACEQVGLDLVVDCPALPEPVFVDREMWEKIVLNLLSNAFKFTFEGSITIGLSVSGEFAEFRVEDTGVGIPDHELPRLFDRFHRIEGQRSRTYEGSGIGLALVQELVRLHGGTIEARSTAGKGTNLIVRLPFGSAHLPRERIGVGRGEPASASVRARAYVQEAFGWGPDENPSSPAGAFEADDATAFPGRNVSGRVLIADDNADMRAYVHRLLSHRFEVEAVADGEAALAALHARRPDLVLADVMMPRLDGFGLLRAIRADPELAKLPVILLSARAGEEASIEGLRAGADDYLIKPFSARELIARVTAHLEMARMRQEAEQRLKELNVTLEAKVQERTQELVSEMAERQKTEAALQQALRLEAVGRLTGGVAHDFNNLLTVILGHADVIVTTALNPRVAQMAAAIGRAADRGSRLTRQMLAFARRQQLQPTAIVFGQTFGEIDDLIKRAAGETVGVEFRADSDLWPVLVDLAQFESALLNLTMNARDAMPESGRLIFAARNAAIAGIEADRFGITAGNYVVISVTDTGTGMSPEVRARAFEPFFTTKDVDKGSGLGLSQIYGFATQSGGTAVIESALGAGTTVSLYLPKGEISDVAEATPAEDPIAFHGRGKAVLIVEDQPDVREIMEMFLEGLGYQILTACDGVEAERILRGEQSIDLLLTDMVMPNGVSGLDLANGARRGRPDLKVVLASGYPREIGKRSPGWSEEFVFLPKPFRQHDLQEAVASALGLK
jgi:signal transduction histidine kinase